MHSPLDVRRILYASVAIFVVVSVWSYLIPRFVMWPLFEPSAAAQALPENVWLLRLWRYVSRAVFSLAFVVIFARGYEGKPGVGEGARYGLLVAALMVLSSLSFGLGTLDARPSSYLITEGVLEILKMVIIGVLANKVYRPQVIKTAP